MQWVVAHGKNLDSGATIVDFPGLWVGINYKYIVIIQDSVNFNLDFAASVPFLKDKFRN